VKQLLRRRHHGQLDINLEGVSLIRTDASALGVESEPFLFVGFDNLEKLFTRNLCTVGRCLVQQVGYAGPAVFVQSDPYGPRVVSEHQTQQLAFGN